MGINYLYLTITYLKTTNLDAHNATQRDPLLQRAQRHKSGHSFGLG
jgi:hypothetical protein